MVYLIAGSILFSSLLIWLFKWSDKYGVHRKLLITINYFFASFLSFGFISFDFNRVIELSDKALWFALFIGILFVVIFNFLAISVKKAGVTPSILAQKTSVVLPVLAGFTFFQDTLSVIKLAGLILTLPAIYLANKSEKIGDYKSSLALLAIVFFGSGSIDVFLNIIQSDLGPNQVIPLFVVLFGVAGLGGLLSLFKNPPKFNLVGKPSLTWGALLGGVNFFALYFIVSALSKNGMESSIFFPINNLGIILFGSLGGWIIFKEKLTRINLVGLILGAISIILIALG
ncbi:MAG: drug/metabolite transporter (DMT)-like permease [Sphingobacteriales bacterium]|jgi:drug/metabolite transporter (DMT)-like permease